MNMMQSIPKVLAMAAVAGAAIVQAVPQNGTGTTTEETYYIPECTLLLLPEPMASLEPSAAEEETHTEHIPPPPPLYCNLLCDEDFLAKAIWCGFPVDLDEDFIEDTTTAMSVTDTLTEEEVENEGRVLYGWTCCYSPCRYIIDDYEPVAVKADSAVKEQEEETAHDVFAAVPQITLYPNPASDALHLGLPEGIVISNIIIFNMAGQGVLSERGPKSDGATVSVQNLAPGMYILRATDTLGGTHTVKFQKR